MGGKKSECSIFIENPDKKTVMILRIGEGRKQGLWTLPGGIIDKKSEHQKEAKKLVEKQLKTNIELYPYEKVLDYPNRIKYIFKGRLMEEEPDPIDYYDRVKYVSYDKLFKSNLEGSIMADINRLEGDFFQVYTDFLKFHQNRDSRKI